MKFNETLREIRRARGMTQRDVYTLLHVSPNRYASWEQGRTQPDIENLRILCAVFDVSADYLLGLADETGASLRRMYSPSHTENQS